MAVNKLWIYSLVSGGGERLEIDAFMLWVCARLTEIAKDEWLFV